MPREVQRSRELSTPSAPVNHGATRDTERTFEPITIGGGTIFKRIVGRRGALVVGLAACALLFAGVYPASWATSSPLDQATGPAAPSLGSAASFAVLGGQSVTNTGPTVVNGNLGVSPGTAVTGFPPGIVVGGTIHAADAVALQAQSDVTTAYNVLAGQPCNTNLTGQDLGGLTLLPGVYCFSSSAQLTGTLTLDAQGNPSAVFIFQIGSTLTTASNSSVQLINGGNCGNVFFQVGSSATLGTGTTFVGNILALTSVTLGTGASVSGRVLARNGSVTLDNNNISFTACGTVALTLTAIAATQTAFPLTATALPLTATAQALTATPLPLTATAIAGTATALPLTATAIAGTASSLRLTATALPLTATAQALTATPLPLTATAVAGTQTAIPATLTAIAATLTPRTVPSEVRELKVCKTANLNAGIRFTFAVTNLTTGGPDVTVQVPIGSCAIVTTTGPLTAGSLVRVVEVANPALPTQITGITAGAAATINTRDLAAGSATVRLGAGDNVVIFDNTVPAQLGAIEICKVAGPGVTGNFTFDITGGSVPNRTITGINQGETLCTQPFGVNAGPVTITERVPAGQFVELVRVSGGPRCQLTSGTDNPVNNPARLQVTEGASCLVTFIDKLGQGTVTPTPTTVPATATPTRTLTPAVSPTTLTPTAQQGSLIVCKQVTAVSTVDGLFSFTTPPGGPTIPSITILANTNATQCTPSISLSVGSVAVTEAVPSGFTLQSVTGGTLSGTTATAQITAGQTTTLTFVNAPVTAGTATFITTKSCTPNPLTTLPAQVTCTITAQNTSSVRATNLVLTDVLPTNTTFNSVSVTAGTGTCTQPTAGQGGTVTCTFATVASSTSAAVQLGFTVPLILGGQGILGGFGQQSQSSCSPITNTATFTTTALTVPSATATIQCPGANLPSNLGQPLLPPPLPFLPPPPPPLLPPPSAIQRPVAVFPEVPVIPEAGSLVLLIGGLAALGGLVGVRGLRRRRND